MTIELYVVPSPTHPHFAAINDSEGMNIMHTLNGTPVMRTERAERIVALLKAQDLDPYTALEVATENYRQWLEEDRSQS